MLIYKWSLISLFSLGLLLLGSCKQNAKNYDAEKFTNRKKKHNIQCDSNVIKDLVKKAESQKDNGQFLEALSLSKELVASTSLNTCPQARIQVIQLHIELLYNYGLEKGIIYEMEELVNEALLLLEEDKKLIPLAKEVFYWAGILSYGKRSYSQGINQLRIAIDLVNRESRPIDTVFLVQCYSKIANLQKGAREFDNAENSFQKANSLAENLPKKSFAVQQLREDMGTYFITTNDSLNTFQIIKTLGSIPKNDRIIFPERLKALWYFKTNQIDKAIDTYLKVEEYFQDEKRLFRKYFYLRDCLWMLSQLYLKKGQHHLVQQYLTKDFIIEDQYNSSNTLEEIFLVSDTTYKGKSRDFLIYGLISESLMLQAEVAKNDKIKKDFLNRALSILEQVDGMLFNYSLMDEEETAAGFIQEFVLEYYPKAIDICYQFYSDKRERQYLNLAASFLERFKSFSLVKDIRKRNQNIDSTTLHTKLTEIDYRLNTLKMKLAKTEDYASRIALVFLAQKRQTIVDSIKQIDNLFFENIMQRKFNPQLVVDQFFKNKKEKSVAILQYFIQDQFVYLFYNDKENSFFIRREITNDFELNIQRFKKELSAFNLYYSKTKFVEKAQELFTVLIGKELYEKCLLNSEIVIIPSKELLNLPFEAFVHEDQFLVQKLDIRYAFSLQTFLDVTRERLADDPSILAFSYSNPNRSVNFSTSQSAAIELVGAAKEVLGIKALYPEDKNQYFFGASCNKAHFLKSCQNTTYDIIHLALHAVSNSLDKYTNYLLLRDENDPTQIAQLSSYEIENLSLSKSLVVLSACSTNKGKSVDGEGLYSLARAFKKAGANQIITTLWDIEDHFTNQIIQSFYLGLKSNDTPTAALCKAKRKYLEQADDLMQQPYFWSGYICLN